VAVTHYFSIDNAKRDLGYRPTITTEEGSRMMGQKYWFGLLPFCSALLSSLSLPPSLSQSLDSRHYFRFTHPALAIAILSGMTLTAIFAFESPEAAHATPSLSLCSTVLSSLRSFSYLLFQSQTCIRSVFFAAVGAHVLEACVALYESIALGCSSDRTVLWFLQTVLYGYGSLGLLYERKAWLKKLNKMD
jgi:hypothetical protein